MTVSTDPNIGLVESRGAKAAPATGRARIWLRAVRPFSFTASVVPIAVASALAAVFHSFDLLLAGVMLLASVLTHAGANLANDYFDHTKGIDTEESMGPSKVIQEGLLTPAQVSAGAAVAFALATLLGLYVVFRSGWEILALALVSLSAAVLYTGGPRPLGYIALGEIVVFLFMGPVMVCGAFFVLHESFEWQSLWLSLPIGMLVAAILHANNIRDIALDQAAGKVTLATKFGRSFANREYLVLTLGAFALIVALIPFQLEYWPLLLTLLAIGVAIELNRMVFSDAEGVELNRVLRKTAGLHLRFGTLLVIGLLAVAGIERWA